MKHIILMLTISLGLSTVPLSAQQVTKEVAMEKAMSFLHQPESSGSNMRKAPRKAPQLVLANDRDDFYVFNDEANGGYVVVSGDERMPDVLGYSYDGHFDNDDVPCNLEALLEGYAEQVAQLRSNQQARVKEAVRVDASRKAIEPMVECTWGHWVPYNNLCPAKGGKRTASGCVAIAMAQIMHYHQWPKETTDFIPGYTTQTLGIEVPALPVTAIDWDNILPYYDPYDSNSYSKKEADAVATLMQLCNVAVEMDYGLETSGAYLSDIPNAMIKYFDYDSRMEDLVIDDFEEDEWNQIVYDELSKKRPVICSQPGHAFVIDGCDQNGYFHMNFGEHDRVTRVDGYFLLSEGAVYELIIGIQPSDPNSPQAYATLDNGKMTFYYDTEKANRSGKIFSDVSSCASNNAEIKECEFDPSFANMKMRNLKYFFANCTNLKSIAGINHLNTADVRSMCEMFIGCSSLKSLDLSSFNTEKVTDMEGMFRDCSALRSLDISHFDTKKVMSMMNMFCRCSSLTSLDVSSFDTENVESMDGLFYDCSSLKTLDVSKFNTGKVTDMAVMFQGCSSLSSLDLSNFNTENVTRMGWMFGNCTNLKSLNVSSFKTGNVQDMSGMFYNCNKLTSIYASEQWDMSKVENKEDMFGGCTNLVGGKGTVYDWNHSDGEYARIDEGSNNPGYLTNIKDTAIRSIKTNETNGAVYNLSGIKISSFSHDLNHLGKGLYLVKGKKMIK
ncbi:MAG: BspA family leucine-rich repeat surface protein [Bacteroidaceae bacterium]|nr:BspA family leucine-rich repeat surface protein [Bacteroidaceae bacterium]